MQNLKEYRILSDTFARQLEEEVNDFIKNGWVPLGGVQYDDKGYYNQAMGLPAPFELELLPKLNWASQIESEDGK